MQFGITAYRYTNENVYIFLCRCVKRELRESRVEAAIARYHPPSIRSVLAIKANGNSAPSADRVLAFNHATLEVLNFSVRC